MIACAVSETIVARLKRDAVGVGWANIVVFANRNAFGFCGGFVIAIIAIAVIERVVAHAVRNAIRVRWTVIIISANRCRYWSMRRWFDRNAFGLSG